MFSPPPLPGVPSPDLYVSMIALDSSIHLLRLSGAHFLTFPPSLTSQFSLDMATTLASCIIGQLQKTLFPTRVFAKSSTGGSCAGSLRRA